MQNLATMNTKPTFTLPKTDDQSLKSTWSHRASVVTGCTTVLVSLASSIVGAMKSHTWVEPMLAGFLGYLFADFATGVYHWIIDNYGDASTPLFGPQINGFQGHHKFPSLITKHEFANILNELGLSVTCIVMPVIVMWHDRAGFMAFVGVGSGCVMFSQKFHAWAHESKNTLPLIVVALQDAGVLISRNRHAAHHRKPFDNNYCIVSGICNRFLDEIKMFKGLEMVVFYTLGISPRSWSEPNFEWMEEEEISSHAT